MKPCIKYRKILVWLSLGELAPAEAAAIRAHVANCEGCRRYLADLSESVWDLQAAAPKIELEASARFHQRVVDAVHATSRPSLSQALGNLVRLILLDWRVAFSVTGVIVAALVILAPGVGPGPTASFENSVGQVASVPKLNRDTVMTAASYWLAADQSFQAFEDLLNEQSRRQPPPGPVYTPMMAMLADLPE